MSGLEILRAKRGCNRPSESLIYPANLILEVRVGMGFEQHRQSVRLALSDSDDAEPVFVAYRECGESFFEFFPKTANTEFSFTNVYVVEQDDRPLRKFRQPCVEIVLYVVVVMATVDV